MRKEIALGPVGPSTAQSPRTTILAFVIPAFCWGVGFPTTLLRSRVNGLAGIWEGLALGYGCAMVVLLVAFLRSDWPDLVRRAQLRAERPEPLLPTTPPST